MSFLDSLLQQVRQVPRINRLVSRLVQRWYGLPVDPLHYYSPLPDIRGLKRRLSRWHHVDTGVGIDWNLDAQVAFTERLAASPAAADTIPSLADVTAQGYGPGYGDVEARTLYLVLRQLRPKRVIEVGSGVSTVFTLAALDANRGAGTNASLTCIEPFPRAPLRGLAAKGAIALDAREVQDADPRLFEVLERNDVLFIDSTHVSKKDSDVDFLVLDVLPRLAPGVVVHIHDIPFPFQALPADHPLFDLSILWNEAALVKAFLLFNSAFEVLMCQSLLHVERPDVLKRLAPKYNAATHVPTSLWLRRR
jgi:predicted O-methyltransferase YrrM